MRAHVVASGISPSRSATCPTTRLAGRRCQARNDPAVRKRRHSNGGRRQRPHGLGHKRPLAKLLQRCCGNFDHHCRSGCATVCMQAQELWARGHRSGHWRVALRVTTRPQWREQGIHRGACHAVQARVCNDAHGPATADVRAAVGPMTGHPHGVRPVTRPSILVYGTSRMQEPHMAQRRAAIPRVCAWHVMFEFWHAPAIPANQ